jgi:methylated-DNA-[protein]-cysteine S-methyltransferase
MGELVLGDYNNQLCLCDWYYRKMRNEVDSRIQNGLNAVFEEADTPLLVETQKQLEPSSNNRFGIPCCKFLTARHKPIWAYPNN